MGTRGLAELVARHDLAEAVDATVETHRDDPRQLAAELWRATIRVTFGDVRLVESTPPVVTRADSLERMLGDEVAMIDVVRDGRDVAHSLVRMRWGPDDVTAALHWWANRIRSADKSRRHCAHPPLVVRFEELADPDLQRTWAERIATHIGDLDADDVAAGFSKFEPRAAHIGAWRKHSGPDHEAMVDALYAKLYDELATAGVEGLPTAPDAP